MLKRVIQKTPDLKVIGEISDLARLASTIAETGAEWVVVSLPPSGRIPETVESSLTAHPSVRVLAVAPDGSQVKMMWVEPRETAVAVAADGSQIEMHWTESREKDLDDVSMDELIAILRKHHSKSDPTN
jgi:hypothetical protein